MIERVACSWHNEDGPTSAAREKFADSAAFHDAHGDDMTECDSWLCVCGRTDSHGSWEASDKVGKQMEPTGAWAGHLRCTSCWRVYDREGYLVSNPESRIA